MVGQLIEAVRIPCQERTVRKHTQEHTPVGVRDLDSRLQSAEHYYQEVYKLSDESTPEGQALAAIGRTLEEPQTRGSIRYILIHHPQENLAFANGDTVYISSGAIRLVNNEGKLAALLAHEINHVEKGDTYTYDNDTNNPSTMREIIAEKSKPRFHEYRADTTAVFKLDRAGYNPTHYADLLKDLKRVERQKRIGFGVDHGLLEDRVSLQEIHLRGKDYRNSTKTKKRPLPPELLPAHLRSLETPDLFTQLIEMYEADSTAFQERLTQMSSQALLNFHVEIPRDLNEKLDEYIYHKGPSLDVEEIRKVFMLTTFVESEIDSRLTKAYPDLSEKEKIWMKTILYTEVADRRFGNLQELHDLLVSGGVYVGELNYAGKLLSSLESPEDMVQFASLAANPQIFKQMGYEIHNKEFPNRTFSWFLNSWKKTGEDQFFLDFLSEKFDGPDAVEEQADLIERVGEILGAKHVGQNSAKLWTHVFLGRVYGSAAQVIAEKLESMNPFLYDIDTPQATRENAPLLEHDMLDLYERLIRRELPYTPRVGENFIKQTMRSAAFSLYKTLDYEEREAHAQQLQIRMERRLNPDLHVFAQLIEQQDTTSLVTFINQKGINAFFQYAKKLFLSSEYKEYAQKLLPALLPVIESYIPSQTDKELVVREFVDNKAHQLPGMAVLQEKFKDAGTFSEELLVKAYNQFNKGEVDIDALMAEQEERRQQINYDSALKEIGITEADIRLLTKIDLFRVLTIGGNEKQAFQHYVQLINSLSPNTLSAPAFGLVFHSLISHGAEAGHALTDWREGEWKLRWGKVLQSEKMIQFRDRFMRAWQQPQQRRMGLGQEVSLKERFTAFRNLAKSLTEFANKDAREPESNWFGTTQESAVYLAPVVESLMNEVSRLSIHRQSVDDLKMLYEFTQALDDKRLAGRMRLELELQMVKLMTFDEATAYLDDLITQKRESPLLAMDYYQEHLVCTKDQVKKARSLINTFYEQLEEKGDERLTALMGFDYVFEDMLSDNTIEFFEAAMRSGDDDTHLRKVLGKVWYKFMMESDKPFRLSIPTAQNGESEVRLTGGGQHQFIPFEQFVDEFYRKLSQTDVDIILRKLLISEHGILMTSRGRKTLHALLMEKIATNPKDTKLRELVSEISEIGLSVIEPTDIYFPLSQLLREQFLVKPPQKGSNSAVAKDVLVKYKKQLKSYVLGKKSSMQRAKTTYQRKHYQQEYKEAQAYASQNTPALENIQQLLAFSPADYLNEISGALMSISVAKDHVTKLSGLHDRMAEGELLRPLDVVLEFSKHMGAVGVRFLQLLGQYVQLSAEYQERFDEAYDKIRGQLKFTAYETLEREATDTNASPELKKFWENLYSLSPTVSGGSLMTVYVATMNNGSEKIVKILNPNTEEFIRRNIVYAREVVEKLRQRHPQSKEYALAEVLLGDLEGWLIEDINKNESHVDTLFEDLNNGFTVQTSSKQTITIGVPKNTPTGTKYVKIEERIKGNNLSDLVRTAGKEAARPYVEAVEASYRHQTETVESGSHTAYVHSDVHIGNVRVGQDGKLYWLDNQFKLPFSQEEVELIVPLINGTFDITKGMQAISYLLNLPENKEKNLDATVVLQNLFALVQEEMQQGGSSLATANSILIALKKQGVHIPLKYSLYFKNLRSKLNMQERVRLA